MGLSREGQQSHQKLDPPQKRSKTMFFKIAVFVQKVVRLSSSTVVPVARPPPVLPSSLLKFENSALGLRVTKKKVDLLEGQRRGCPDIKKKSGCFFEGQGRGHPKIEIYLYIYIIFSKKICLHLSCN